MAKTKIKEEPLTLGTKQYLNLLKSCFTKPNSYASIIPEGGNYTVPITFFIINFCILSLLPLLIDTLISRNPALIFIGVVNTLFTLPLGVLFLFIFSGLFFVIAKLLGGIGTFKSAFNAMALASTPMIFSWIPFAAFVFLALAIYILIVALSRLQHYSLAKAVVTVLFPVIIGTVLLIAIGIIGQPFGKIY